MRDEIDARLWVEHGPHFAEDMGRLLGGIKEGLGRLTDIQFRAPWRRKRLSS